MSTKRRGAVEMRQRGEKTKKQSDGFSFLSASPRRPLYASPLLRVSLCLLTFAFLSSCTLSASRGGIPPEAQAAIDSLTSEIDAGEFDKIYKESAEEWRHRATPEESKTFFETLKTRLGNVKSRAYHTATEQHNTGGSIPGHSFVITYRTTFDHGEGMETITLLEREGRWLLAGYFVNSDALK